jgi:hypothetical protein
MKYRTRINYSDADKALMWDRWQSSVFDFDILIVIHHFNHYYPSAVAQSTYSGR